VEQQLLTLQNEKKAASEAATKAAEGNNKKSAELEKQVAALQAEMEAIGKEKKTTISQGMVSSHIKQLLKHKSCHHNPQNDWPAGWLTDLLACSASFYTY
jgi:hypothetical protein